MKLRFFPKDNPREGMKGSMGVLERKRENMLVSEERVSLHGDRVGMRIGRYGEKKRRREETISLYLSHKLRQIWAPFLERRT